MTNITGKKVWIFSDRHVTIFYKLVVTNLFYIITADSIPIAILYEYLWQKSLPFGKSKIPLVNKLINPLVRVIPQKEKF